MELSRTFSKTRVECGGRTYYYRGILGSVHHIPAHGYTIMHIHAEEGIEGSLSTDYILHMAFGKGYTHTHTHTHTHI